MNQHDYCDRIRRRDVLRAGVIGGLGIGLGDMLRYEAQGAPAAKTAAARQMIFVNLVGGPSHMDTFDLKPNAKPEFRGEFKPIATEVPGMEIAEHLPKLARQARHFVVARGVSHSFSAHNLGQSFMNSGNSPISSIQFPSFGAVVSREFSSEPDLPGFVAIPDTVQTTGYLGIEYAPLKTNAIPQIGKPFSVRGVSLGNGVTVTDLERREKLLNDLDVAFEGHEKQIPLLAGLDRFEEQAHKILTSSRTRTAFDISREPVALQKEFGDHQFGQSSLLAVRLIESGVRFVTISFGGWDTHADNFQQLKSARLPHLDSGLSMLLSQLHQRGLLESTLVCVTGEFGRTPKINPRAGRDHWARAMFVLLAGGGVRGGRVVGASDENGMGPKEKGIRPDDLAATIYRQMGIDPHREYHTSTGRPVMIVRDGTPLPELVG